MSPSREKLLELPSHGVLLASTDLQGNLEDFRRMRTLFHATWDETEGDAWLLFMGDVVHGPDYSRDTWPEFLGTFYEDRSPELIAELQALMAAFPGRVRCLLGNHEHSHIGGPVTSKFHPNEAAHLEERLGIEGAMELRQWLRTFSLVARAPNGLIFTHGAPAAEIDGADDVRRVRYGGYEHCTIDDMAADRVLGRLLWARGVDESLARQFVQALGGHVCLYGHDVIAEGYERRGNEQLIFSTSYGLEDAAKVYVRVDLSRSYRSAMELREGIEILPLVRDAAWEESDPLVSKKGGYS